LAVDVNIVSHQSGLLRPIHSGNCTIIAEDERLVERVVINYVEKDQAGDGIIIP